MEVNDSSDGQYSTNNNIRLKIPILRPNLCDYSDANIVVKWEKAVEGTNANNQADKKLSLKIMLHLGHTYKKSVTFSYIMQKISCYADV